MDSSDNEDSYPAQFTVRGRKKAIRDLDTRLALLLAEIEQTRRDAKGNKLL
jgi:hypothetical protein